MSTFVECSRVVCAHIAASPYGRFGNLSKDAADLIVEVAGIENISPALLAVTWLNESVFKFYPPPNTNGYLDDFEHWDVGGFQLNVYWTGKVIEKREAKGVDGWDGSPAFNADGTAANFNGDPLANARTAAQRLLAIRKPSIGDDYKNDDERRAVKYTGPGAQPYRLDSYREYAPLFDQFFQCYGNAIL